MHSLDVDPQRSQIPLGGLYIAVAHHFLNRSDISAVFDQNRGKGVAERMGRDFLFYFRGF